MISISGWLAANLGRAFSMKVLQYLRQRIANLQSSVESENIMEPYFMPFELPAQSQ